MKRFGTAVLARGKTKNEWLEDDASSEDDDRDNFSETLEDSRTQRPSKRRRLGEELDRDSDQSESDDDDRAGNGSNHTTIDKLKSIQRRDRPEDDGKDKNSEIAASKTKVSRAGSARPKPKKKSKTGIVYMSRVPPFMKPQTVKSLLAPYGEIGRLFLTPEDQALHSRRIKTGGSRRRLYTDGWVEFIHKKDAKLVAETLNAQIIGGKKGGWYHDDIWNIKYLKGFKWHHLTEQIANENAERAARLRAEIAQTARENRRFMANVEKAKMLDGIKAKKASRTTSNASSGSSGKRAHDTGDTDVTAGRRDRSRKFEQHRVKEMQSSDKPAASDSVQRVLNKIF